MLFLKRKKQTKYWTRRTTSGRRAGVTISQRHGAVEASSKKRSRNKTKWLNVTGDAQTRNECPDCSQVYKQRAHDDNLRDIQQ